MLWLGDGDTGFFILDGDEVGKMVEGRSVLDWLSVFSG